MNVRFLPAIFVLCRMTVAGFSQAEIKNNNNADYESSDIPILLIGTDDEYIPDEYRIDAHMGVINNTGNRNYFDGAFNEYDGNISIEQRGSSSAWVSDKKSYAFETQNDTNGNLNVSLLGMPKENDWILIGEYSDKTLIRNALAYELSRRMGHYAPRTRFCELVLNDDYRGVYMLTEKVKRDKHRLDIASLEPDELAGDSLTGGYIIRIDRPDEYWVSPYRSPAGNKNILISYYYPEGSEMPYAQKKYIRDFVTEFEDALHGDAFSDPYTGYLPYIDLASFVDYFIVCEISKNIDAYRLSTFMHKDKDSKGGFLTMGPVWDVNLGFGNANYYSGEQTSGWVINSIDAGDDFQIPFWWLRLREDSRFNNALKVRWTQLRYNLLSETSVYGLVDSIAGIIGEAQERNFERWPILDQWVWPNAYVGGSYENEIDYLLSWLSDRAAWIDEQLEYPMAIPGSETILNDYEIYAYPNPFVKDLTIKLYMLEPAQVQIVLINSMGVAVMTHRENLSQGSHDVVLQPENQGLSPEPGIYMYQVSVKGVTVKTGKVLKGHL
jgi:hypothetical protein